MHGQQNDEYTEMHGQQNDKYTEMHGQQNDKYTEMHGQQNVKKMYDYVKLLVKRAAEAAVRVQLMYRRMYLCG